MKKKISLILLLNLFIGPLLLAESPESFGSEARTAHLQWRKARRNLDLAYLQKLESVLEKVTKAGNLDEAVAIREEMSRISNELEVDSEPASLAEFLVGTTWSSEYNGATVTFQAGGKAVRTMYGKDTAVGYRIDGEKEFSILWTAAVGKAVMAEDRHTFKSGEAIWTLK